MNQRRLNKAFIWGFLFLYLMVALISFCHAVQFFNIGNEQWMSIVLAFSFELGLALSLASILLSDKNKSQTFPWILMIALTTVQVVGNVYSVFKHVSLSQEDYYQYLAKPLLFFMEEVDENTIQVVVSWIMGAILPIVALLMTDMVASNIKHISDEDKKPDELSETNHIDDTKYTEYVQEPVMPVEVPTYVSKAPIEKHIEKPVEHESLIQKEEPSILKEIPVSHPAEPILSNPTVFEDFLKSDNSNTEDTDIKDIKDIKEDPVVDEYEELIEPVNEFEEYIPSEDELNELDSYDIDESNKSDEIVSKDDILEELTESTETLDNQAKVEPELQKEMVKPLNKPENNSVNIIDVITENLDSSILGKNDVESKHSIEPVSVSVNDIIQNLDKTALKESSTDYNSITEKKDNEKTELLNATGYNNKKRDTTYFAESIPSPFNQ